MLTIYGASDDLVEFEGSFEEEIGCYDEQQVVFRLQDSEGQGCFVIMRYAPPYIPGGVWTAEVAQLGEDLPIPWPLRVSAGGSTVQLESK